MRRPGVGVCRRSNFRGVGGGAADPLAPLYDISHALFLRSDPVNGSMSVISGETDSWSGEEGTHTANAPAAGNRPTYNATDSVFGGRPSVLTDEATPRYLTIAHHASLQMNAAGLTLYVVLAKTSTDASGNRRIVDKFSTAGGWTTNTGGDNAAATIRNAAATASYSTGGTATPTLTADQPRVFRFQHDPNTDIGVRVDAGTPETAAAADYGTGTVDVGIGANRAGSLPGSYRLGVIYLTQTLPSAAQDTQIMNALKSWAGLSF